MRAAVIIMNFLGLGKVFFLNRTYAFEFVVAQFIARRRAFADAIPIVGGASCPTWVMKHQIATPHRPAA